MLADMFVPEQAPCQVLNDNLYKILWLIKTDLIMVSSVSEEEDERFGSGNEDD